MFKIPRKHGGGGAIDIFLNWGGGLNLSKIFIAFKYKWFNIQPGHMVNKFTVKLRQILNMNI